jgi:hypothetical protein
MNAQDTLPAQKDPLYFWNELRPSEKIEALALLLEAYSMTTEEMGPATNGSGGNAFQLLMDLLGSATAEVKALEAKEKARENRRD